MFASPFGAEEPFVVARDVDGEALTQQAHVVPVVVIDGVSRVVSDKGMRRDAPHCCCVDSTATVEPGKLVGQPIAARAHDPIIANKLHAGIKRVQIYEPPKMIADNHVVRTVVAHEPETRISEARASRSELRAYDRQIKIGVRSGLLAEQRVNCPAAINPCFNATVVENRKDRDNVGTLHRRGRASTRSRQPCADDTIELRHPTSHSRYPLSLVRIEMERQVKDSFR